jgi:hypothetical protein
MPDMDAPGFGRSRATLDADLQHAVVEAGAYLALVYALG